MDIYHNYSEISLKEMDIEDCGTVGYCLAIKRSEIVPFTERCMDLETVTQTVISKTVITQTVNQKEKTNIV